MTNWDQLIATHILKKPGQHCLVVGTTGTGKTQLLYWLVESFTLVAPKETIVWFDSGKSAEILQLAKFKECTIHCHTRAEVAIATKDPALFQRFTLKKYNAVDALWRGIEKDRINIFCIEPFYRDPKEYSKICRDIFMGLINSARDKILRRNGVIPLSIFIDELQWIVPTEKTALSREQNEGAKWFQRNIETMRSQGIRIVGAVQNWQKIRMGTRESFSWLFLKRGARFYHDRQQLQKYNMKWMKLDDGQFVLVMPDSYYSEDFITTPFYGNAEDLGEVEYNEIIEKVGADQPVQGYG